MTFTPTVFENVPPGTTPTVGTPKINATELNKLGSAVDDVDARLTTVETALGSSGDITTALVAQARRSFFNALIQGS